MMKNLTRLRLIAAFALIALISRDCFAGGVDSKTKKESCPAYVKGFIEFMNNKSAKDLTTIFERQIRKGVQNIGKTAKKKAIGFPKKIDTIVLQNDLLRKLPIGTKWKDKSKYRPTMGKTLTLLEKYAQKKKKKITDGSLIKEFSKHMASMIISLASQCDCSKCSKLPNILKGPLKKFIGQFLVKSNPVAKTAQKVKKKVRDKSKKVEIELMVPDPYIKGKKAEYEAKLEINNSKIKAKGLKRVGKIKWACKGCRGRGLEMKANLGLKKRKGMITFYPSSSLKAPKKKYSKSFTIPRYCKKRSKLGGCLDPKTNGSKSKLKSKRMTPQQIQQYVQRLMRSQQMRNMPRQQPPPRPQVYWTPGQR